MSHASSSERLKMSLKKAKESKIKKQQKDGEKRVELGDIGYEDYIKRKYSKTTKQKVALALWDYKMGQYPFNKRKYLKTLLIERLEEIELDEIGNNKEEKTKIKVVLNELN